MKKLNLAAATVAPALLILFGSTSIAQNAPDNTKSNSTDPSNRAATSDMQGNSAADIDLVKRIRQSVMGDSSLSSYGHNVKIVAMNGTVTLNGVVKSPEEKTRIGTKARSIAGDGHVVDDMKIAPSK